MNPPAVQLWWVSRCFSTVSSRTPSKWLTTRDCFGSQFYLYHPILSGLQAFAEVMWKISKCLATAPLVSLSAPPARDPSGFIISIIIMYLADNTAGPCCADVVGIRKP
jgi:hypothetical protein